MNSNASPLAELDAIRAVLDGHERPVVLLEGTRALPDADRPRLIALAAMLACLFPRAVFRTGNAPGSDEAFAEGVAQIDVSRLEYVVPYATHRVALRQPGSRAVAVDAGDESLVQATLAATLKYLALSRNPSPTAKAKWKYLLRDTLKVAGSSNLGLAPAACGVFYVNPDDAMKGGTGHTLRACRERQVQAWTQDEWMAWLN